MIKWFKRITLLIILILALCLGITIAYQNGQAVNIILLNYPLPELKLGLWVVIILLIGSLIGLILSYLPRLWMRNSIAAKDRKIRQLEKELNQLRAASLKG